MRTLLAIVVTVLVAIGAAAHFHHPLFNPRFAEFPVLTGLHVVLGGLYLVFLVALGIGTYHIRAGRVVLHREWMIRAFAIGLGIATQRVFFVIPRIVLIGHRTPTRGEIEMLMLSAFGVAFVLRAAVAEAWIRSGRSRRSIAKSAAGYAPIAAPT